MQASEPTDRQVRADVYKITRAYLEVERGLRPPEHLRDYLTPTEYRRHRTRPSNPRTRTGEPVLPTDVGRIHLDRHLPGQITANVSTREAGETWGALVLHFVRDDTGRWSIDQLERLTRPLAVRRPTRRLVQRTDPEQRIERVEDERRLVDAAHHATSTRLDELRRATSRGTVVDEDAVRKLGELQQAWERRRGELDDELARLRHNRELRETLASVDIPSDRHPTELTDAQIEQVLGPVPDSDWRRRLREGVLEEIHDYRRRWNVTDQRSVLGPTPTDPDHQHDRDELADTFRASARALGTHGRDAAGRDREVSRRQARGQSRECAAER